MSTISVDLNFYEELPVTPINDRQSEFWNPGNRSVSTLSSRTLLSDASSSSTLLHNEFNPKTTSTTSLPTSISTTSLKSTTSTLKNVLQGWEFANKPSEFDTNLPPKTFRPDSEEDSMKLFRQIKNETFVFMLGAYAFEDNQTVIELTMYTVDTSKQLLPQRTTGKLGFDSMIISDQQNFMRVLKTLMDKFSLDVPDNNLIYKTLCSFGQYLLSCEQDILLSHLADSLREPLEKQRRKWEIEDKEEEERIEIRKRLRETNQS